MNKYQILVLTDHGTHSKENSIYDILQHLYAHPKIAFVEVASRSAALNQAFFNHSSSELWVTRVDSNFNFERAAEIFIGKERKAIQEYDAVFLRLPHPIKAGFWNFLRSIYPEHQIFNRPSGIEISSSKAFLLEVPHLCPPIQLCKTVEDIQVFHASFPIVLKPLSGYGGKGIVKLEGDFAWDGKRAIPLDSFYNTLAEKQETYLGMKFLKNVDQGDKRIVVVNGQVIGASLRLPPKDSWLCNASQGGQSQETEITAEEYHIAEGLTDRLTKLGVMFFGFDTLVDDSGKRVLSEVNTLSIGGVKQIAQQKKGLPILATVAKAIVDFIEHKIYQVND